MPNETLHRTLQGFPTGLLVRTLAMHISTCACEQCIAIIAELESRPYDEEQGR